MPLGVAGAPNTTNEIAQMLCLHLHQRCGGVSSCTYRCVPCSAPLCGKRGCDSVYLVILLSTFLWYSFVISLPMPVSLIPIMAKCTTATPPTLVLSLPHKLFQPPQHQPKASKQSSLWGGKMVACVAATNHWWGQTVSNWEVTLGLTSCSPINEDCYVSDGWTATKLKGTAAMFGHDKDYFK